VSILSLVKDSNKQRVEDHLIRLLQTITHYFPEPSVVTSDELLLTLTELIEPEMALQIYDYLSGFESYHSQGGEYAVVSLKCALRNKINIKKFQSISLEDEIEQSRLVINSEESQPKADARLVISNQLENSLNAAKKMKASPYYSLLFITILHEIRVAQEIKMIEAQPDYDNFKNRRIKLMNELITLLASFRNNQITFDKFHHALVKHSQKTRVIPHTSYIGATFGFFVGKLTSTSKLAYDFLDLITPLKVKRRLG
jgi:DNA-directed RNA polymerase beta subunit